MRAARSPQPIQQSPPSPRRLNDGPRSRPIRPAQADFRRYSHVKRNLSAALLLLAAAACSKHPQKPSVQLATVVRRDIIIEAQRNGVIEPIVIVDVKSKAGGVITQMPVETGTHVQ